MARPPITNPNDEDFNPESFMNEILDSEEEFEFDEDEDEDDDEDEFGFDEDDEENDALSFENETVEDAEIQTLTDFNDVELVQEEDEDEDEDETNNTPTENTSQATIDEQVVSEELEMPDGNENTPSDDVNTIIDDNELVNENEELDTDYENTVIDEEENLTTDDDDNDLVIIDASEPTLVTRENTAAIFFETLDEHAKSSLISTFATVWRNMINDAGGEDFQEKLRELNMRHSIAMEQLELYDDGENAKKLQLAQKDIEEIESIIANTTVKSKAPEEMTIGMVRYALDLGILFINESDLEGKSELFRSGIQFNGETFTDRIDIASTRRRSASPSTGVRTRTVERKTKPCTEIVVYEQGNNNSILQTFNGREYGVRPLTNATILLADQNGSPFDGHGCSWDEDKDEYVMPRKEDCKNLPFTAGGDGEGKAQVHFLASLACSTQTRVMGIHHGEVEFDMVPDGTNGLYILDSEGTPYRTGKIRTEAKTSRLNLID